MRHTLNQDACALCAQHHRRRAADEVEPRSRGRPRSAPARRYYGTMSIHGTSGAFGGTGALPCGVANVPPLSLPRRLLRANRCPAPPRVRESWPYPSCHRDPQVAGAHFDERGGAPATSFIWAQFPLPVAQLVTDLQLHGCRDSERWDGAAQAPECSSGRARHTNQRSALP